MIHFRFQLNLSQGYDPKRFKEALNKAYPRYLGRTNRPIVNSCQGVFVQYSSSYARLLG